MEQEISDITDACSQLKVILAEHVFKKQSSPVVIAIDGGSGSGKSTLASIMEQQIDCVVVQLDEFFAADIPDWEWDSKTVVEKLRDVFDWSRVRSEALEPLLDGEKARWHPFDFAAGLRADGTYGLSDQWTEKQPAPVILLEGAYSAGPQVADVVDLKVLIHVPKDERHRRLEEREPDKQFLLRWHFLWDPVEDYYFDEVMPVSAFDLVVEG